MGFGRTHDKLMVFQAQSFDGPCAAWIYAHRQSPSGSVAVLPQEGVELDGVGREMLNYCAYE